MLHCFCRDPTALTSLSSFLLPSSSPPPLSLMWLIHSTSDPMLGPSHTELGKAQPLGDRQGQGPSLSKEVSVMTKVLGVTRAQEEREEAGSCSHSVQTACSMFVCRVSVPLSFHSLSHPTPMTHPKVGTGPISLPRLPIPTMLSLPKAPSLGEQPLSLCKTTPRCPRDKAASFGSRLVGSQEYRE